VVAWVAVGGAFHRPRRTLKPRARAALVTNLASIHTWFK
jgi:hypothetical protein